MVNEHLDLEKTVKLFRESWKELINEYPRARAPSTFCSEADVQLHLAHKLLDKLPHETVHIEFPIPFDIARLEELNWEKTSVRDSFKPDIAIFDPVATKFDRRFCPYLLAELKFVPIRQNIMHLYQLIDRSTCHSKEEREKLKDALEPVVKYYKNKRQAEPNQQEIEKTYFGVDKHGRTNVEKLIAIMNSFQEKKKVTVVGYLCIIDEIYPNIKKILQEAIKKYNPPNQFKILAQHFTTYEGLVETLNALV